MYAIYVKDTRKEPFTEWILDGRKIFETRDRDSLRSLLGETVAIIRTGNGPATVVGYAEINRHISIEKNKEGGALAHYLFMNACISEKSKYRRVKEGGKKHFYSLENARPCAPFEPIMKVNHGFSYTEIYGPGEKTITAETAPEIRKEIAGQIATRGAATIGLKQLSALLQTELRNL